MALFKVAAGTESGIIPACHGGRVDEEPFAANRPASGRPWLAA
jgi:hypothetical protein